MRYADLAAGDLYVDLDDGRVILVLRNDSSWTTLDLSNGFERYSGPIGAFAMYMECDHLVLRAADRWVPR